MRIHIDNFHFDPSRNERELDVAHVNHLAELIAKYGLLTALTVRKGAKHDKVQQYVGTAGYHRDAAIRKLRCLTEDQLRKLGTHRDDDNNVVPGRSFEELFPEESVECVVIGSELASSAVTVENTGRKDYTQAELCVIVWRLDDDKIDQHEIAARCSVNQGRVSEFLSLRKAIPQAHDAWGEGHIAMRDMLALAALPADKQKEHLAKLTSGAGGDDAGSANPGKRAKAAARKELQGAAKETRRSYANAGKPTRKRLTVLSERIAAVMKTGTEAEKNLFKIIDETMAFVDGRIDEKAFKKWLSSYSAPDIFTDPEDGKPAAEKKSKSIKANKAKPAKAEKKPKTEKPKAEKPKAEKPKAEKKPKTEKPAKAAKAAKKASKKTSKKAK